MTNRGKKLNQLSGLLQLLSFCGIVFASLFNVHKITIGVCCILLAISSILVLFLFKNVTKKRYRKRVAVKAQTRQRKIA